MSKEYKQGWNAYLDRVSLGDCPYSRGSRAWSTWRKGWYAAQREAGKS